MYSETPLELLHLYRIYALSSREAQLHDIELANTFIEEGVVNEHNE